MIRSAPRPLETRNRYIQEQLLARKAVPDWQESDTPADAITSVEYYLERLERDQPARATRSLDVAEDSLKNLGYTLKPNCRPRPSPAVSNAAIESPAVGRRLEAVVEGRQTAEQLPADTTLPRRRGRCPLLASDDN